MRDDDTVVGTLKGDLWQPLTQALAPLGLDRQGMREAMRALAAEDVFPVLEPAEAPPPDHRHVLQNPVTKRYYALRKDDLPVIAKMALQATAAGFAFTDHKAIAGVIAVVTALVYLARDGIVGLDPLHALALRATKKGPRDGSRVSEIAQRLDWSKDQVSSVLAEIIERREGLLKQNGDLWVAMV